MTDQNAKPDSPVIPSLSTEGQDAFLKAVLKLTECPDSGDTNALLQNTPTQSIMREDTQQMLRLIRHKMQEQCEKIDALLYLVEITNQARSLQSPLRDFSPETLL